MLSLTALSLWRLIEDEKLFDTIEDAVSLKLGRGDHKASKQTRCAVLKTLERGYLLPPAKLREGIVFTGVCLSTSGVVPYLLQTRNDPPAPRPDMPPGRNMEPDRNEHHTSRKNMGPDRK